MKKLTSIILTSAFIALLLDFTAVFAQQDPAYSLFMYNSLTINPAMAGSSGAITATALYRKQWAGVEGSPQTQTLNLDGALSKGRKVGLGLSVVNDQIGVTKNLAVNGQYAYRIQFKESSLSMGLQAGFNNYKADYTSVVTNQQNSADPSFDQNTSAMIFNFGSGVYYSSQKLYAGFSVPHIINQKLDQAAGSGSQARQLRHYYFTAGYTFDAGLYFKVEPAMMIKIAESAGVQVDINTTVWYNEIAGLGVSYRTNESVSGILQLQLGRQFRLGYAHDFLVTSLSGYATGNNEIMLRYQLHRKNTAKELADNGASYY